MNYEDLKLKCGIEIHQQLNTGKLFCSCPSEIISNDLLDNSIIRRIRFSAGESGKIDKAAEEEFKKNKYNVYKYNNRHTCLVELDEEPPNQINEKALKVSYQVSKFLNCKIFKKIQFMRKIIIDGSNTSGFQRTSLISIDGFVNIDNKKVRISGVNLEEDSSRIIEKNEKYNVYALDRLGIPLIEIGTEPDLNTPEEVYKTAKYLGSVLRSFKEVKRGLGTIRQDLNISIKGGNRVELKGVQDINLIPQIVENEVNRQIKSIEIINKVKKLGLTNENISDFKIYDLTDIFEGTNSKVIKNILNSKKDNDLNNKFQNKILGIKLYKIKGLLKEELQENFRFATELSDRIKANFNSIKGLFHRDELPNYGITEKEVEEVLKRLNCSEEDNFIIIGNREDIAKDALLYLFNTLKILLFEVPSEVRMLNKEKSKFLRPMPGSSRMYPETDVPVINFEDYDLKKWEKLPEFYDDKIERLKNKWQIKDKSVIERILSRFNENEFDIILNLISPNQAINYIFGIPKEVGFEKYLNYEDYLKLFEKIKNKEIDKNFLVKLYEDYKKNKFINIDDYLKSNIVSISTEEIEKVIKMHLKELKNAPDGVIIGKTIKHFKSMVSGKKISEVLNKLKNEKK